MRVLIVEENPEMGRLWQSHLERLGASVDLIVDHKQAIGHVEENGFDAVVLDLTDAQGATFELSDVIAYRWPETRIIFVTGSSFFSDGSIFRYVSNAAAMVPREGPPEDLAAVVEHHANRQ